MTKPWEMPWDFVSEMAPKVEAERDALKEEGTQMMADLPVMDTNPASEMVVRAPVVPSEGRSSKGMLPWEMDWGGPSVSSTRLPAKDSPLVEPKPPTRVDWEFVAQREGKAKKKAYVPAQKGKVFDNSGVTVGTGVDLGSWTTDKLTDLGVSPELVEKLKPYSGVKGQKALELVNSNPITLKAEEVAELDEKVKAAAVDEIISMFNKESDIPFEKLNEAQQTVIASVFFQYGMGRGKTWPHNFWKQITRNDWVAAKKNLLNFGDKYGARRKLEAALL